jgi:hypothetical protein
VQVQVELTEAAPALCAIAGLHMPEADEESGDGVEGESSALRVLATPRVGRRRRSTFHLWSPDEADRQIGRWDGRRSSEQPDMEQGGSGVSGERRSSGARKGTLDEAQRGEVATAPRARRLLHCLEKLTDAHRTPTVTLALWARHCICAMPNP